MGGVETLTRDDDETVMNGAPVMMIGPPAPCDELDVGHRPLSQKRIALRIVREYRKFIMPRGVEFLVYWTHEEIFGQRSSEEELIGELQRFTLQSLLWNCAVIISGLQLWNSGQENPVLYERLVNLYFNDPIKSAIVLGFWQRDPQKMLFHRRQALLIAKLALSHCGSAGLNARSDARSFGKILLMANDRFHHNVLPKLVNPISTRMDFAALVSEFVAVSEFGSPDIPATFTRARLMILDIPKSLTMDPDYVDVADEYRLAATITFQELSALLFAVQSRYNDDLSRNLADNAWALPFREDYFPQQVVSPKVISRFMERVTGHELTMSQEIHARDFGSNDFTVFKNHPFIIQWFGVGTTFMSHGYLMLDNLFFLDKVLVDPYWTLCNRMGDKFRRFWGSIFEKYVNDLLLATVGAHSRALPNPKSAKDLEISDIALIEGDALVLIESKSSIFRADAKYSGDVDQLIKEVEKKLVSPGARKKKGVKQLQAAVRTLFGPSGEFEMAGQDLKHIKKVYVLLVTLDGIGGTVAISPLLQSYWDEMSDISAGVEIRPIQCTDIATFEQVACHLHSRTLSSILEAWWIANPSLATPLEAIRLPRENLIMAQHIQEGWEDIYREMIEFLFPDIDSKESLREMKEKWYGIGGR